MPILVCAIFDSSNIQADFKEKYAKFSSLCSNFCGIIIADFYSLYFQDPSLLSKNKKYINRDLMVNYIKCARFTLVQKIWQIMECQKAKTSIGTSNSLIYVIDYDFIAYDNFDLAIKDNYSECGCLLSYKIKGDGDKFEQNFSQCSIKHPAMNSSLIDISLSLSHKVIKAGFSCFTPSLVSRYFLLFFNSYAFQLGKSNDSGSITTEQATRSLFSHYYGDQLSLLAAVRDLKCTFSETYFRDLAWINLKQSNIVNLDSSLNPIIFLPKGNQQE